MHSVLLVFFAFRSLVFLLLLFLTMNPHYMTSYNLVFYCSIKKKWKPFFAIMPVRACVFASCVIAINYACAVQSLMSTLDQWVCVMSGRLVYSDWQSQDNARDTCACIRAHGNFTCRLCWEQFSVFQPTPAETLYSIRVRLSLQRENRASQTVNYQMTKLFYHWKGADEQSNTQWATELHARLLSLSTQDTFLSISPAL